MGADTDPLREMWPWGHAAVGYLLYTLYCRVRLGWRPQGLPVIALGLGTQLPDLVDKPLAWNLSVLPNGRSLAHSLLVAGIVILALQIIAIRLERQPLVTALGLGYVSHLFADALYPALEGEFYYLGFLGWPIVPPVEYEGSESILAHLLAAEVTPTFVFETALALATIGLWYRHGLPGLRLLVPYASTDTDPEQRPES